MPLSYCECHRATVRCWSYSHERMLCVASPCSQFKDSRATGNSVKCGKYTVCFSLCMWNILHCQNSLPVSEGIWNTCKVTETVWMWCSAFSHGRTCGQHVTIWAPKQMTMHVMQMPVIREDRCIKLTNVAHDLDISLCSVQCSPPAELLKSVCTLCAKESHRWHKSCTLTGMLIKENSSAVKCLQWQDTCWQAAGLTVISTTIDDTACHAGVLFREDKHSKVTAQELRVLLCNVYSIVWTMELQKSLCTVGAKGPHTQKTLQYTFDTLSDKDSRDCSALLQQMKHGLITWHPNPAKKVWSNAVSKDWPCW